VPFNPVDEEYWLERAREAYALSDQMVYPEAKRLMREIAASYQRLANRQKSVRRAQSQGQAERRLTQSATTGSIYHSRVHVRE